MQISGVKKIITKKIFQKYVDIQDRGEFNMNTEADRVAELIGIPTDDYCLILKNYGALKREYELDN